jgi:aspartyl-tRNA(Asn)/glutamyl-tRNA(Gln) amidotransferase subunit C
MVTKEEVRHLGWLARIDLSEAELDSYTSQIEGIIKYLDKLDTTPLKQVKPEVARKSFVELRPDEPVKFEGDALGTKYRKDGFVKGPRMV